MSLVFGKSFCSWFCPIGFISELIGDFGEKVFKRRLKLPKWLDYPLRSLKYFLLGFLIYSVIFLMSQLALKSFLDSPYNQVSDVKMYYFFAHISQNYFDNYRCFICTFNCDKKFLVQIPLSVRRVTWNFSLLSPNKIQRNTTSCIDCGLCNKACPSFIKVDKVKTVISDECSTCLNCVDACPVKDTLELKNIFPAKKKISKKIVAIGVVSIFMLITGFAMLTGNWQNKITKEEYLIHYKYMNTYGHPTGVKEFKKLNEEVEIKKDKR